MNKLDNIDFPDLFIIADGTPTGYGILRKDTPLLRCSEAVDENQSIVMETSGPVTSVNIFFNGSDSLSSARKIEGWESDRLDRDLIDQRTQILLGIMENDTFEPGYSTDSEAFVKAELDKDHFSTMLWLNDVFLTFFGDVKTAVGILHIISHLNYEKMYPQCQMIAMAAMNHNSVAVREGAIRAFENWCNPDSLKMLQHVRRQDERWLQNYLERVIEDLNKELLPHATVG